MGVDMRNRILVQLAQRIAECTDAIVVATSGQWPLHVEEAARKLKHDAHALARLLADPTERETEPLGRVLARIHEDPSAR